MTAIILPSRGLIHSRTVEELLNATRNHEVKLYFSHDNPIPDCFNKPMQQALDDNNQFFVIIEEDMQIPPDFLNKMIPQLSKGYDIAFYDYPIRYGHHHRATQKSVDILISGTGLIGFRKRAVEQLFPLEADFEWSLNPPTPIEVKDKAKIYGQHDIGMWVKIYHLNLAHIMLGTTGHYSLIEYGQKQVNNGFHKIELLT